LRRVPVTAVAYDSRTVVPGAVFVGLLGERADGTAFAAQAVAKGVLAVVSEQDRPAGMAVPWVRVRDGRLAMAVLAAEFFGHPSRPMQVVGITGTNGKTTTAYLVPRRAGGGRVLVRDAGAPSSTGLATNCVRPRGTTPEAVDLQQMLREMADAGCRAWRDGGVITRAGVAPRR